jgi:hypothetical protein
MDVMIYQPQTETQIQKIEEDKRREVMQDEAARIKDTRPEAKKASAKTEKQDDKDVYIGREGKMVRRGEEIKEMLDRPVRRENRYHRGN